MNSRALMFIVLLATALSVAACQKEKGPMEKAGKKLDNAATQVEDAADEAAKKVQKATEGH